MSIRFVLGWLVAVTSGFAAAGCSSDDAKGGSGGDGGSGGGGGQEPTAMGGVSSVSLSGPCDPDQRLGGFTIAAKEDLEYAYLDGSVKNGIDPVDRPELLLEEGTCRLTKRPFYVCEETCGSTRTCNQDLECQEMARGQDLGTVEIRGLEDRLSLQAQQPGNAYSAQVPNPPVETGGVVELQTDESGYAGEVTLHGVGVERLTLVNARFVLTEGKSLTVRWDPPVNEEVKSEVSLTLTIDLHGSTPAKLTCRFEDTGEATVSSDLIDGLLAAGITGYPSVQLTRRTVDHTDVPDGCMELVVGSEREPKVAITGYTPCSSTSQCPDGQICNTPLERCE